MKNVSYLMLFFMILSQSVRSQEVLNLWTNGVPGEVVSPQAEETIDGGRVRFVSIPTLSIYHPSKAQNNGVCIIICPGGGYALEAMEHEGYQVAEFLQKQG
ncbi:MAG: hypothetical protein LWW85_15510, partial [Marinilabiliales bacterium]|nr:hypothetical protein [Marinilabiliales bacterium]